MMFHRIPFVQNCFFFGMQRKVFPVAYFIMTGKSQEVYDEMFTELLTFADENDVELEPPYIICDGEKAVMNAV